MTILNRKLLRDLLTLRGPVITVALLVAAGVAVMAGSTSTYVSLLHAKDNYYSQSRFADLFLSVKRAPNAFAGDLSTIKGVHAVQTHITQDVRVIWNETTYDVSGTLISLPNRDGSALNALRLKAGRWPSPAAPHEILVNVAFAEAWSLKPDTAMSILLNGRQRELTIVGFVYSPEYIYAARPGNPLPNDLHHVILWADRSEIEASLDFKNAFNQAAIKLEPDANVTQVIKDLDERLKPFGSRGVIRQSEQSSNRFLLDELTEQKTMAVIVPLTFFAVAAFLLNAIMVRLITAQRDHIATLKALGYPAFPIALHYAQFVSVIALLGSLLGVGLGVLYGKAVMASYASFFRFPEFPFIMPLWTPVLATLASLAAALAGALTSVLRLMRMTAADAMRPVIPADASHQLLAQFLRPRAKIALRNLIGRPVRTAFTILGLSTSIPMIVLGLFWWDALNAMLKTQFELIDRSDATVTFLHPLPVSVLNEIARLAPDLQVEGLRMVPVRLRVGHKEKLTVLTALSQTSALRTVRNSDLAQITIPQDGVILNRMMADDLGLSIGDTLSIDILDGQQPTIEIPLAGKIDEVLGAGAYIDLDRLDDALGEAPLISHALLRSPHDLHPVLHALSARPNVLATSSKSDWIAMFRERIMGLITVAAIVLTVFGVIVAIGVVYNSARVAFQERSWELASLRVLGFTRNEVSNILFTELAISLLIAIPIGLYLAHSGITYLLTSRSNESFSIPAVIETDTMAIASLIVICAAILSGLVVKRQIDHLHLVSILKTRD